MFHQKAHLNNRISLSIIDWIEYLSIFLFTIYSFWFQYAFFEISSVILIIGATLLGIVIYKNSKGKNLFFFKETLWVFLFVLVSVLTGIIFAYDIAEVLRLGLQMAKYIIPMIGIVDFIKASPARFKMICFAMSFCGILMSFTSIFFGSVTSNGGVTIGDLNANSFASYILLCVFCSLSMSTQSIFFGKVFSWTSIGFCAVSVFNAASRRAALVFLFVVFFYVFFYVFLSKKYRFLKRIFFITISVVTILFFINSISKFSDDSALLQRFLDSTSVYSSDALRQKYQSVAFMLFKTSPVFGRGLGCVAAYCGVHSHSMFFELLACTGIMGTFIVLFALFRNTIVFLKKSLEMHSKDKKMLFILCAVFVAATIISSFQVTYIYDAFFYITIGVIVGVLNVSKTMKKEEKYDKSSLLLFRK